MPKNFRLLALLIPLAAQSAEPIPSAQKILSAHSQVVKWMEAHEQERLAIVRAYAGKDAAALERTAIHMARNPGFSDPKNALMRNEFAPFLKCDTAQRDLGVLASAMARNAARGTPLLEKIVLQEQADYDRNSAICKRRLAMSPAVAWGDYQAE